MRVVSWTFLLTLLMPTGFVVAAEPEPEAAKAEEEKPKEAPRPFRDVDLFSGHSLRQSSKDRKIAAGVNMHFAPVPFVAAKALSQAADKVSAQYPDATQMVSVLKVANATRVHDLAVAQNVDGTKAQIQADFKSAGVTPTADQQKAIDNISASNIGSLADIAQVAATPSDALAFGIEPWFEYNFGTYDLTAYVPMAAFYSSKEGSSLELGNINLDFRAGSRKGYTAAVGWTGGLSLYLPTGTEKANVLALSNALVLPKYLHEYVSVQPYGIVGGQLSILTLMVRAELTGMFAVRDNPLYSTVMYGNWGVSSVIRAVILDLVAEVDGLVNLYNAPGMQDIFATAGMRFHAGPVRFGAAARLPITSNPSSIYAQSFGQLGNVAKVNFLLQGFMTF
jgi:hypothetical protein